MFSTEGSPGWQQSAITFLAKQDDKISPSNVVIHCPCCSAVHFGYCCCFDKSLVGVAAGFQSLFDVTVFPVVWLFLLSIRWCKIWITPVFVPVGGASQKKNPVQLDLAFFFFFRTAAEFRKVSMVYVSIFIDGT